MNRKLSAALLALVIAACGRDGAMTGPAAPPASPATHGVLALGTDPVSGASIETNKDDYQPGEVVHLVGRGWAAGETVNLHMTEEPNTHADVDTNVVADANGGFSIHFYDVQLHDLGVTFTLTATGQTSGSRAVAVFTDGSVSLASTAPVANVVSFAVSPSNPPNCTSTTFTLATSITLNAASTPSCVEVRAPTSVVVSGTTYTFNGWSATLTQSQGGLITQVASTANAGTIQTLQFNANHSSAGGSILAQYAGPSNNPPTAKANGPYSGGNNTNVALSGVGSTDVGGSITTYAWTYSVVNAPGGTCTFTNASSNSPTGASISCTVNGLYEVKLTVTDNQGATDDDVADLTISNTAPTANPGGPYNSVAEGSSLTLNGSGSDTDGNVTDYLWSWQKISGDAGAGCTIVNPTQATASISCTDDGTFEVKLTVTDDDGETGSATVNITVTNVPPSVQATGGAGDEGSPISIGASFDDAGDNDTHPTKVWTYTLGAGAAGTCLFGDASAESTTITCTDNGTFNIKYSVTDDDGSTGEGNSTVTVANVAPTVQTTGGSGDEGSPISISASFDDAGDNDTHPTKVWSYTPGANVDGGATCSFGSSSASPTTITCTDDGTYTIKYSVTDDDGSTGEGEATVTVANVAPVVQATGGSGIEGSPITISASFDDAGDNDTHPTRVWSYTAGVGAEGTCTFASSSASPTTITCSDDGSYTIKYTVTDDDGTPGYGTATVTVANDPPVITTITAPVDPVAAGLNNVTVTWKFTDPGADTWTCSIDWDNGQSFVSANLNSSTKTCSATTTLTPGLYSITVKVADDDTGEDSKTVATYVVVYDPNGGFVTGGGWYNSVAGNYRLDPLAAGKANFGFVSKYQPGKTVPQGNTEFQFHAGNLDFKSTIYEWLVVAGAKAMYKGEGTIAGRAGVYRFLLSAIDGSPDKFRIKIWEKSTAGTLIYDTLLDGAADDDDPTTTLGGGSIVIHTKK